MSREAEFNGDYAVIVAGRTDSVDRTAQGSRRIMPCCLCEGDAAEMAAALPVKVRVWLHSTDARKLHKKLIGYGAYLPKLHADGFR